MQHQLTNDENSIPKLSIEELKSFRGFENLNDEEADEIINSLLQLAIIVYNINN